MRLEAAAGADAEQLLDAELDQLLEDDRRAGAAHAGALDGDAACPRTCRCSRAGRARRSSARRPRGTSRRCTWRAAGRRAGGTPRRSRRAPLARGSASRETLGPSVPGSSGRGCALVEPRRSSQILAFCAEDPVERVFLEDVARRGLGRFSAASRTTAGSRRSATSARTSSRPATAAARSPTRASRAGARMLIGERARRRASSGRRRGDGCRARATTGPASRSTRSRRRRSRARRACARRTLDDLELLVPACALAHEEELGVDPLAARPRRLPLAHAGADRGGALVALGGGRRDPLQGRGLGVDAVGGAAPAGLGRPAGARPGLRAARHARPLPAAARARRRWCACSSGRRTAGASGSTRRSGCAPCSATAAILLWRRCSSPGTARPSWNVRGSSAAIPARGPVDRGGREEARRLGAALAERAVDLCVVTRVPAHARDGSTLALAGRDVPRSSSPAGRIRFGDFEGGPLDVYREWAWSGGPDVPEGGEHRGGSRPAMPGGSGTFRPARGHDSRRRALAAARIPSRRGRRHGSAQPNGHGRLREGAAARRSGGGARSRRARGVGRVAAVLN